MQVAFTHDEPALDTHHVQRARPVRIHRGRTARTTIFAGALAALLLAGCSGGSGTSTESRDSGGTAAQDTPAQGLAAPEVAPDANSAPGAKPGTDAQAGTGDAAKAGTPVVGVAPKLTKSASVDLEVKEIAAAAARVRSIAAGVQAQVLNEQIGSGSPGDPMPLREGSGSTAEVVGFGTLTLSVPADKLDSAMDQLTKVGTVQRRSATAQDVTSQYVDTESRLKTMRASVDRVRALMAQAKDIGQVVALESEMSRRQADLESLESQLAALKTSVERSTLAVSLRTPTSAEEVTWQNGFLAGLRSGWDAFTASAGGLFEAIGAALPFVVFLAAVAAPIVWWWRRRQTNRPPATPAPSGPTA